MNSALRGPHYIVWLHGGLGNQLFQWAMATALALRHGGHAWGDRSYLAQDTLRKYALDQFLIDFPEPPETIVEKIIGRPRYMDTPATDGTHSYANCTTSHNPFSPGNCETV